MRRAELIVAVFLAIFSLYLMWKSTELPIGWDPDKGPGGGAFPFWLSAGMLVCALLIAYRTLRGLTPESRSTEPFMDRESFRMILIVVASLTALVAGIHVIGIYGSVPLFLIFYLRYMGKHSWVTTLIVSLTTPVVTFLFFEKLLLILLPKGITDELFYIFF
ncbi:MAG: tripartite tricarboxylate transporter TctB family protein [SAR324 cluster bacterium]|nr:tripartite tricarboxylate transporter TctB family protein [SAR324 cluster bacterium]